MTAKSLTRLGLGGAAVALAVTATVTAATASPTASSRPSASSDRVTFAIGGNPEHPDVITNGAISSSGKDDPNHAQYDVLHLQNGTLRVEHPNKDAKFVPTIDRKTCFVSFKEHGTFTLDHGTGKYAGVTGGGKYHATGYSISKRKASGKCDLHSRPKTEIFTVSGSGTVH
jgi:hypothetical protein